MKNSSPLSIINWRKSFAHWLASFAFVALIICAHSLNYTVTAQKQNVIASPDNKIKVSFRLNANGAPRYSVVHNGKSALLESKLGLVRNDGDFSTNLKLLSATKAEEVRDSYEILTAKRRLNNYAANRVVFHLQNAAGKKLDVIFQVSNDGLAFRYLFPDTDNAVYKLSEEKSSFHFSMDTKAWLQPMAKAQTGWQRSQPSYEEYYEKEIPVGTPSKLGEGWIYPALFRSGDEWILVSESGMDGTYCGTRLKHESPEGEYQIGFPDPQENKDGGAVNPESKLPWATPWRVIVVGSLATITESTLGIDVAPKPARAFDASIFEPGKSSWSWVLLGDNQTTYETQKRFIDYAAQMNWRYCLIDALWDKQIGYEKIKELADYARTKNVKILLWYNSAGAWNSTPQTPRNLMLTHESRIKEFERLKAMGIAGLKIDFFGGDGQSFIKYYIDILEDAARYDFVINFHGATLPRGWQRTHPNLLTMEAIRGFEFVTFEQANADEEPTHAAMLPFTRNVFDPMDFTPMALNGVNERIQRRTTSAFELALSILFTSGIQHYAETPEGMAKIPADVQNTLKTIPSVWDDIKFIDGYPGKYVVIARRGGNKWYLAAINGENTEKKIPISLFKLPFRNVRQIISDDNNGNLSVSNKDVTKTKQNFIELTLKPRGGLVVIGE